MAITHRTLLSWSGSGGNDISGTVTESANAEQNRILAIAATTADQEFDLDFPFAKLKSIFMLATGDDLTVETNTNNHAGGDEIDLVNGVPFWWVESSGVDCPFTADVTKIFVTPAGAKTIQLDIRILYDATA